MFINIHMYDGLSRRAAYPLWLRFGINRFELTMLSSLCGFLAFKEQTIVSKVEFFSWLTGNGKDRLKQQGYFFGLLSKGFIGQFEYVSIPGSQSIGLSERGVRVIEAYYKSIDEIMHRYNKNKVELQIANPSTKYKRTA